MPVSFLLTQASRKKPLECHSCGNDIQQRPKWHFYVSSNPGLFPHKRESRQYRLLLLFWIATFAGMTTNAWTETVMACSDGLAEAQAVPPAGRSGFALFG